MITTKKISFAIYFLVAAIIFSGCKATRNANNKQKGAVIGAAGGAILGAIIGNNVGKGGKGELGAVIGGVVGGAAGVIIGGKMDRQAKRIEEEIPGAVVERIDDGIVVTFDENSGVHFATNKYAINSDSQNILNKLSTILEEYPDTKVLVVGHTDSVGSDAMNMQLSKNRSYSVSNYLTGKGLKSSRFITKWFGETQPKHNNSTSSGRAKNRRVNIVILPNDKMINEAKNQTLNN